MDPISHLVAGSLAGAVISAEPSLEQIVFSAAIAILPDFDFATRLFGEERFHDMHRGPTHSLVGVGVISLLGAGAGIVCFGWAFWTAYLLALVGLLSHILLDFILHGTGIELLWPFSQRRVSANLVMGLNPRVNSILCHRRSMLVCFRCMIHVNIFQPHTYVLLLGFVATLIQPQYSQIIAVSTFGVLMMYLLIAIGFRQYWAHRLHSHMPYEKLLLYPAHPLPHAWVGVSLDGDKAMTQVVGLGTRQPINHKRLVGDLVDIARRTPAGQFFDKIALHPAELVTRENDQTIIHLYDLSHVGLVPEELFSARVVFDSQNHLVAAEFREKWVPGTPPPAGIAQSQ